VCVDLFLLGQGYMDVATLGVLATATGGSVHSYVPFAPAADQDQLLNDLKWNVSRPQGLEAILRVRASAGLDVEGYVGAFYKPPGSPTDVYLPAVDCNKAVVARLAVVERLQPGGEAVLQSALLYTGTDGGRRIRVSTLALPVSDQMGAVFKGADLDAQVGGLLRRVRVFLFFFVFCVCVLVCVCAERVCSKCACLSHTLTTTSKTTNKQPKRSRRCCRATRLRRPRRRSWAA
jgi:protein transport protein SEC24